jgi:flagellin
MVRPLSSATGLSAIFAFQRNQRDMNQTLTRLSTGRRINSGKDDPAGLISSERLSAEIKSLEAESRSLARADANANIAEGNAAQMSGLFSELRSLQIASANEAGLTDGERAANQQQVDNIVGSIERFYGDATSSLERVSLPGTGNADVTAAYDAALAAAVSVRSGGANDLSSGNSAAAMTALDAASTGIATARGRIGGYQKNVVGPRLRSNEIAIENLSQSRSIIADTDYAVELSKLAKQEVIAKAGAKVLKIAANQSRSILDMFS